MTTGSSPRLWRASRPTPILPFPLPPGIKLDFEFLTYMSSLSRSRSRPRAPPNSARSVARSQRTRSSRTSGRSGKSLARRLRGVAPRLPATSNRIAKSFRKAPRSSRGSISWAAGTGGFKNRRSPTKVHAEADQVLLDTWAQPVFSGTVTATGAAQNLVSGALVCPPLVIHPMMLDAGRLAVMCSLFQEWRPRRIALVYKPTLGEFNNGSLIFAYSKDPTWTPFNVTAASTATYEQGASLRLLSEQAGARSTHIAKDLRFNCIGPTDFTGDSWLLCSPTNVAGVISRLTTAGIAWVAIEGLPTNSSATALTGQPGYLTLEYDIEFRGPTDNALGRSIAEAVNQLDLTSATGITATNPLQLTFGPVGNTAAYYTGPELGVCFLSADMTTVTSGTLLGKNQPLFLAKFGTNNYYYAYTTIADAILGDTAHAILASVTTTANVVVPVSAFIPLGQIAAG